MGGGGGIVVSDNVQNFVFPPPPPFFLMASLSLWRVPSQRILYYGVHQIKLTRFYHFISPCFTVSQRDWRWSCALINDGIKPHSLTFKSVTLVTLYHSVVLQVPGSFQSAPRMIQILCIFHGCFKNISLQRGFQRGFKSDSWECQWNFKSFLRVWFIKTIPRCSQGHP